MSRFGIVNKYRIEKVMNSDKYKFNREIIPLISNMKTSYLVPYLPIIFKKINYENLAYAFNKIEEKHEGAKDILINKLIENDFSVDTNLNEMHIDLLECIDKHNRRYNNRDSSVGDDLLTLRIVSDTLQKKLKDVRKTILDNECNIKLRANLLNTIDGHLYNELGIKNKSFASNVSKDILIGPEIEEVGVYKEIADKLVNNNTFFVDSDISLKEYDKSIDKVMSSDKTAEIKPKKPLRASKRSDMDNIFKTLEVLKDNGATTNYSCGFHVHVSSKNMYGNENEKIAIAEDMAYEYEYIQDMLYEKLNVYKNRKDEYARPITLKYENDSACVFEYLDINIDEYEKLPYITSSRNTGFNALPLFKDNNVEFRFFNLPDKLDPVVALSFIDFSACFTDYVSSGKRIKNLIDDDYKDEDGRISEEYYDKALCSLLEGLNTNINTKKVFENYDEICDYYSIKEPSLGRKNETLNMYDNLEL